VPAVDHATSTAPDRHSTPTPTSGPVLGARAARRAAPTSEPSASARGRRVLPTVPDAGRKAGLAGQDGERVEAPRRRRGRTGRRARAESGFRQRDLDAAALVLRAERRAPSTPSGPGAAVETAASSHARRETAAAGRSPADRRRGQARRPPSEASASARAGRAGATRDVADEGFRVRPPRKTGRLPRLRERRGRLRQLRLEGRRGTRRGPAARGATPCPREDASSSEHGTPATPGGAPRDVFGHALGGPGGLGPGALCRAERSGNLVERVEEDRARVASGARRRRLGAEGAVLLAAVPSAALAAGPETTRRTKGRAAPRRASPIRPGRRRREKRPEGIAQRARPAWPAPSR